MTIIRTERVDRIEHHITIYHCNFERIKELKYLGITIGYNHDTGNKTEYGVEISAVLFSKNY